MDEWNNECINEKMNGWMKQWNNEWMNETMNGLMKQLMDEWNNELINEKMNGWMKQWNNEWMNETMNGLLKQWMNEWILCSCRQCTLLLTGWLGTRSAKQRIIFFPITAQMVTCQRGWQAYALKGTVFYEGLKHALKVTLQRALRGTAFEETLEHAL